MYSAKGFTQRAKRLSCIHLMGIKTITEYINVGVSLSMKQHSWYPRENTAIMAHVSSQKCRSGPSCSKLTTSLVKDSLKFTSSDTQICWNFLLKKCE